MQKAQRVRGLSSAYQKLLRYKQISEHGEIYTAGKNFALPPAVTAWTNLTFVIAIWIQTENVQNLFICVWVGWWGWGGAVGWGAKVGC